MATIHTTIFCCVSSVPTVLHHSNQRRGELVLRGVRVEDANLISWVIWLPYSRKFLRGPNFHDFRDPWPKCEIKNCEMNIWTCGNFLHMRFVCYSLAQSDDGTASLFQTGRRRTTVSHGRSFVLCKPGHDKGAWSIAHASAKCKS